MVLRIGKTSSSSNSLSWKLIRIIQTVPIASITFSLIIVRVESVVNSPPTTRRFKTGPSSGSSDPDYSTYAGTQRGVVKTHPSLIASDDLERGINEFQLKPMPSGQSDGEGIIS